MSPSNIMYNLSSDTTNMASIPVGDEPMAYVFGPDSFLIDYTGTYVLVDGCSAARSFAKNVNKLSEAILSYPNEASLGCVADLVDKDVIVYSALPNIKEAGVEGSATNLAHKIQKANLNPETKLRFSPKYEPVLLDKRGHNRVLVYVLDGAKKESLDALEKALNGTDADLSNVSAQYGLIFAIVWQGKYNEPVKRILYTGNASYERIIQAFEKANALNIFAKEVVTPASLVEPPVAGGRAIALDDESNPVRLTNLLDKSKTAPTRGARPSTGAPNAASKRTVGGTTATPSSRLSSSTAAAPTARRSVATSAPTATSRLSSRPSTTTSSATAARPARGAPSTTPAATRATPATARPAASTRLSSTTSRTAATPSAAATTTRRPAPTTAARPAPTRSTPASTTSATARRSTATKIAPTPTTGVARKPAPSSGAAPAKVAAAVGTAAAATAVAAAVASNIVSEPTPVEPVAPVQSVTSVEAAPSVEADTTIAAPEESIIFVREVECITINDTHADMSKTSQDFTLNSSLSDVSSYTSEDKTPIKQTSFVQSNCSSSNSIYFNPNNTSDTVPDFSQNESIETVKNSTITDPANNSETPEISKTDLDSSFPLIEISDLTPEVPSTPQTAQDLPEAVSEPVASENLPEIIPEPEPTNNLPEIVPESVGSHSLPEVVPEPVDEVPSVPDSSDHVEEPQPSAEPEKKQTNPIDPFDISAIHGNDSVVSNSTIDPHNEALFGDITSNTVTDGNVDSTFVEPFVPQAPGHDGLLDNLEEPVRVRRISMDTDKIEETLNDLDLSQDQTISQPIVEATAEQLAMEQICEAVSAAAAATEFQSEDSEEKLNPETLTAEQTRKISQHLIDTAPTEITAALASSMMEGIQNAAAHLANNPLNDLIGMAQAGSESIKEDIKESNEPVSDKLMAMQSRSSVISASASDDSKVVYEQPDPIIGDILESVAADSERMDNDHGKTDPIDYLEGEIPQYWTVSSRGNGPYLKKERYFEVATVPHKGSRCTLKNIDEAANYFHSIRAKSYILASEDLPMFVLEGWLEAKKGWGKPDMPSSLIFTVPAPCSTTFSEAHAGELSAQHMSIPAPISNSYITVQFDNGKEMFNIVRVTL